VCVCARARVCLCAHVRVRKRVRACSATCACVTGATVTCHRHGKIDQEGRHVQAARLHHQRHCAQRDDRQRVPRRRIAHLEQRLHPCNMQHSALQTLRRVRRGRHGTDATCAAVLDGKHGVGFTRTACLDCDGFSFIQLVSSR
jgi:hypothetical protein